MDISSAYPVRVHFRDGTVEEFLVVVRVAGADWLAAFRAESDHDDLDRPTKFVVGADAVKYIEATDARRHHGYDAHVYHQQDIEDVGTYVELACEDLVSDGTG
ncbi:hypothetical protein [Haloarchaeobius amylolyticus]|uniref:hypothetical protein n=1 Tax=Haloarchaeobius amylolyticus TaxID=1198296 RepID=UPI00226F638E|nr:hypothetical protein [Haloarchaeobius amylolyticus]